MTILISGAVLLAGCTQQQPVSSSVPVSGSPGSPTPGPVVAVDSIDQYPAPPADNAVSAQINEKDQTDKTISVFFSGGKGQKMVKDSWIIIKRSDGKIERVPLTPKAQSEVVLQGTEGEDLIRVYAEYFDGNTYQIAEKSVRMRQRI